MATSVLATDQIRISQLEAVYTFENPDSVRHFLKDYALLIPVLEEAPAEIKKLFGATPLTLRFYRDPEYSEYMQLIAGIVVDKKELSVKEANRKLTELDTDWWLDKPAKVSELLSFVVKI